MKVYNMLSILLVAVFLAVPVSADWFNNTFNNSLTAENLTYTGAGSSFRYLSVPENIYLTRAEINLSGFLGTTRVTQSADFNATSFSSDGSWNASHPVGNFFDGSGATFARGDDNTNSNIYANYSIPAYYQTHKGAANFQFTCHVGSNHNNNFIYHSSNELPDQCFDETGFNPVQIRSQWDSTSIWQMRSYCWDYDNSEWDQITSSAINKGYSGTCGGGAGVGYSTQRVAFFEYEYPTNVSLDINGTNVYSGSGELNTTNSPVFNEAFHETINNYLLQCTYVGGVCDVPFNFTTDTSGNIEYSAMHFNKTLEPIEVGTSCPAGYDLAQNYSLTEEENLTALTGDFDYNFIYGDITNNTLREKFGSVSSSKNLLVCINSTYVDYEFNYGEIQYDVTNYVSRRYYNFEGLQINNQTQNITLYNLLSSAQTSFKLEVEDSSLAPYTDVYTTLVRWYPASNEYNVVDMGLTDETGSTVIHVRTEDVDYRIGVYERNGSLIKLANPIRMVCLVSPCTYTLKVIPGDQDYTSFLNIDYTLDYNKTTGDWSFVFSDSTQKTTMMNLTVYKQTGTSVYPVCSTSISASSGALTCNTLAYSGTLKAVVTRSASPPITIAEKIIGITTSAFSSTFGLWISFLIAIPIIFIFAFMTPLGAVIGGVVSLLPALYFGAVNWAIVGGVAVLGGIVMHFLKRIQ